MKRIMLLVLVALAAATFSAQPVYAQRGPMDDSDGDYYYDMDEAKRDYFDAYGYDAPPQTEAQIKAAQLQSAKYQTQSTINILMVFAFLALVGLWEWSKGQS